MLFPANTGSGESLLVIDTSASACTVVVAVPVLLAGVGSVVVLAATALLVMIVPPAVPELTLTTTVNTAVSPGATGDFENTTLPVPPTAGDIVVHPLPL